MFIDRDPEKMVYYGKEASEIICTMEANVAKLNNTLMAVRNCLDDHTLKEIEKLNTCTDKFLKQMDEYDKVARACKKKGEELIFIRERR